MTCSTTDWITAAASVLGAIAAAGAVGVAWSVWDHQKLLSQRQLVLPLWQYMSSLNGIKPDAPAGPLVVKNVNTLELIALCCEGKMVDSSIIKRTFLTQFIALYDQIAACGEVPGLGKKTGKDVLAENPAATSFYRQLKQDAASVKRFTS